MFVQLSITTILLLAEIPDDDDDDEIVYCTCKRAPSGDAGRMIKCENKKCPVEWYHYGCVGLKEEPNHRWLCPTCKPPAPSNRKVQEEDDDEQYNSDTVYCICRRPESGRMIACVNPHCAVEWYHLKCVGLTKNSTNLLSHKKWLCPSCKQDPAAAKYITGASAAGGAKYCWFFLFHCFCISTQHPLPPFCTHIFHTSIHSLPSFHYPLPPPPPSPHHKTTTPSLNVLFHYPPLSLPSPPSL